MDIKDEEYIEKHWKPVYVLSGAYGYCETCICYDEQFGVFFMLNPDDNYYHWNGYNMSIITKELAEKWTKKNLDEFIENTDLANYENYFKEFSWEIQCRITKKTKSN